MKREHRGSCHAGEDTEQTEKKELGGDWNYTRGTSEATLSPECSWRKDTETGRELFERRTLSEPEELREMNTEQIWENPGKVG